MPVPAFSILVPTYNAGDFLLEAVGTAVAQMAADDELVVQDGGSDDGSVDRLADRYRDDPRVQIASERDSGQSEALTRALARARNPVVGWLNADDVYYPGALDAVRSAFSGPRTVDLVYGGSTLFGEAGGSADAVIRTLRPAELTRSTLLRQGCHVFSGSTFIRTDLVRSVGGFDADLHYSMDYDLFLRLAATDPVCARLDTVVGGLRWHDASKSSTMGSAFVRETLAVQRRHARGTAERLLGSVFVARFALVVATTPVRHSRWYSRVRPTKRF